MSGILSWSLYFQGYFVLIQKEMKKRHGILGMFGFLQIVSFFFGLQGMYF